MLKKTLIAFTLPLLSLLAIGAGNYTEGASQKKTSDAPTGTLQKMIVESGSVTIDLDLSRLNGITATTQKFETVHFAVAANSFFPILVFNDLLRGPEPGRVCAPQTMGLCDDGRSRFADVLSGRDRQPNGLAGSGGHRRSGFEARSTRSSGIQSRSAPISATAWC